MEGPFKAQCTTPRCDRCAVFWHATEGCERNCSRCGGTHATVDWTAREPNGESGDPDRSGPNERPIEENEDGGNMTTLVTTDDMTSEENTQSRNIQVNHSKENEGNEETPPQAANAMVDKCAGGKGGEQDASRCGRKPRWRRRKSARRGRRQP
ncbi:hypothetical protein HPB48_016140 [Haemaphysalis longicornis]|uniref:Uncharacterized protein n=1 Tax=Haemaphysalis longicornis TaxID=44386 RepID=A0A9J6FR73_HAELO|nr:hypothetical protein HPB48_016140 [Haemaphysalis longicornis]